MTKLALVAGGDKPDLSLLEGFDYYVGIDRGSLFLLENGLSLDMAVGDFDSVSREEWQSIKAEAGLLIQSQPEKDDTDTELALKEIFKRQPQAQVFLFGAFGGRLDHFLSNIFLPSDPELAPFMQQIHLLDEQNQLSYYPAGQHRLFPQNGMTYISFMTEGEGELTIKGAKYELDASNFFKKKNYSSNEFTNKPIDIELTDGYLIAIYTKDRN
ncbi:thiamine diphosphokinase [Streptococcus loxodontisalivarius]|uniref:Thiamine diphosphokinase n=1 Tax=Streptococcus loxodontisalivarius TaxID=1349415 RepID=A0ABS2PSH7_9STRE|nr:thiamine diphosphokinase [Streptococcus loxodontisalivarius]MBM7642831.1 thiamine pyrophosphokinase [Streptococcus loxodontisalivarius]